MRERLPEKELVRRIRLALPPGQRRLQKKHGTPAEFAQAVYRCVPGDISMDEAKAAIAKYQREWDAA